MKNNSKVKLLLNILLLVGIFAVMFYLLKSSLGEILMELQTTPFWVLLGVVALGVAYIVIEGWNIKELARPFQRDFAATDGMLAMCYSAFYRVVTFGAGTIISEVNFYRRKGLKVSQGVGVTALHMVMYKAALFTYAAVGLVIQFSLFYHKAPKMIGFVIAGMVVTFLIIGGLLLLSLSLNLQILFVKISNKYLHSQKLRGYVDQANTQIYSLRETVQAVLQEKPLIIKIYLLNLLKMIPWYLIPYFVLVWGHPQLDFLLVFALISFAVILAGVIPTPAGIGSFEFVYLMLFKPMVGTVDAVSSMLLYRFVSYVFPFLIGFIYVLVDKRRMIKHELTELLNEQEASNGK